MTHYIQPTLRKQLKAVMLHVVTKDISRKSPEEIESNIEAVCEGIVKVDITKVIVSEIISRQSDDINLKINRINNPLQGIC